MKKTTKILLNCLLGAVVILVTVVLGLVVYNMRQAPQSQVENYNPGEALSLKLGDRIEIPEKPEHFIQVKSNKDGIVYLEGSQGCSGSIKIEGEKAVVVMECDGEVVLEVFPGPVFVVGKYPIVLHRAPKP